MNLVFKSAVDWWYYLLVFTVPLVLVLTGFFGTPDDSSGSRDGLVLLITGVFAAGLPVWLLFSTSYHIDDQRLTIKSGPFRWQIDRVDIHGVSASRSVLSSPALSLNRIRIDYGAKRSVLVSPIDRDAFVQALGFARVDDE